MKKPVLAATTAGVTSAIWAVAGATLFMNGTIAPAGQAEPTAASAQAEQTTTAPATTETDTTTDEEDTTEETTTAPEEADETTTEDDESSATSDGGGSVVEEALPEVDLGSEDPDSTIYLRAEAGFNPTLSSWAVNADQTEIHVVRYSCTGSSQVDTWGSIEMLDATQGFVEITWEAGSPELAGYGDSSTSMAYITERTLSDDSGSAEGVASTRHDSVISNFTGMCADAGETAAAFVLG